MNDNNEQAAYETWRNSLPNGSLDVTPAQAWQARASIIAEQEQGCTTCNDKGSVGWCPDNWQPCPDCGYLDSQPSADYASDITIILSRAYDEIAYLHSKIMQHSGIESDGRSNSVCLEINEFLAAMKVAK